MGLSLRQPNDSLSHRVAAILIKPGDARDRLTKGIYISDDENDITGCLEDALLKVIQAEPVERRLRANDEVKSDLQTYQQWVDGLLESELVSAEEADMLVLAHTATRKIIMVDDFTPQELNTSKRNHSKVA